MARYNSGRDGCSLFRRMFGKPCDGSICKFGEQVHYKLSGRPSSRVEPRWELGAWFGKMELTDEHLLGSRTVHWLTKSHCYNKDALDRIVRTPTNPKPDGAVRDPEVRRQYITQRWVDDHGVTLGCPRCEGRGSMSQSEKCRKRFGSIEKDKLDKQLEEAARNAEPPPVIAAEMDVEQPREQPSIGEASSSSAPEAVPLSSPSTHEVRMETAEPSSSTRPVEGGDESSSKQVRSLAGMLLFDENDTSDWQHSVRGTRTSELSDDQHDQHDSTDHMCGSGSFNRNPNCTVTELATWGGVTTSSRVMATRPTSEVVLSCSSTCCQKAIRSIKARHH